MPSPGDVDIKFGRKYMFLNPDASLGPGAWRLSAPDSIPGQGGGGDGGIDDIDGDLPIVAENKGFGTVEISMDITQLDNIDTE